MPEAIWIELCCHGGVVPHGEVPFFCFGGWDVADRFGQPPVVEPADPFKRGVFDGLERPPRSAAVDDLDLVESVDRFGQGVMLLC
jgi:hypothetical protein